MVYTYLFTWRIKLQLVIRNDTTLNLFSLHTNYNIFFSRQKIIETYRKTWQSIDDRWKLFLFHFGWIFISSWKRISIYKRISFFMNWNESQLLVDLLSIFLLTDEYFHTDNCYFHNQNFFNSLHMKIYESLFSFCDIVCQQHKRMFLYMYIYEFIIYTYRVLVFIYSPAKK